MARRISPRLGAGDVWCANHECVLGRMAPAWCCANLHQAPVLSCVRHHYRARASVNRRGAVRRVLQPQRLLHARIIITVRQRRCVSGQRNILRIGRLPATNRRVLQRFGRVYASRATAVPACGVHIHRRRRGLRHKRRLPHRCLLPERRLLHGGAFAGELPDPRRRVSGERDNVRGGGVSGPDRRVL